MALLARCYPFVLSVHVGLESGGRPAVLLDGCSFFVHDLRVISTVLVLLLRLIVALTLIHLRHFVRRFLARGLLALLAIRVRFRSDDWLVLAVLLPATLSLGDLKLVVG